MAEEFELQTLRMEYQNGVLAMFARKDNKYYLLFAKTTKSISSYFVCEEKAAYGNGVKLVVFGEDHKFVPEFILTPMAHSVVYKVVEVSNVEEYEKISSLVRDLIKEQ